MHGLLLLLRDTPGSAIRLDGHFINIVTYAIIIIRTDACYLW
jgi:hypothetical protein